MKTIESMLISIFHKEGMDRIIELLKKTNIKIYSTGGTFLFLKSKDLKVTNIEEVTGYPPILSGRVKTLHPKILGGIVAERIDSHIKELNQYAIPRIDCVVVDLYPFEETQKITHNEDALIEKIDIGGISLIRAAAKNYKNVVVIPSKKQYPILERILENGGMSKRIPRKQLGLAAFRVAAQYDTAISNFYNEELCSPQVESV
ncbi:MAG: hypothetical protein HY559_02480 [Gammaproteobacteria bacterium]|nr:hypothetical protein [Gammaproteobacteria bacterium]